MGSQIDIVDFVCLFLCLVNPRDDRLVPLGQGIKPGRLELGGCKSVVIDASNFCGRTEQTSVCYICIWASLFNIRGGVDIVVRLEVGLEVGL